MTTHNHHSHTSHQPPADHPAMHHDDHGQMDHSARDMPAAPMAHDAHAGHNGHADHSEHADIFKRRFWICLILSVPVILYSEMVQDWLGFSMPSFPGSGAIPPVLGTVIFLYGGRVFL